MEARLPNRRNRLRQNPSRQRQHRASRQYRLSLSRQRQLSQPRPNRRLFIRLQGLLDLRFRLRKMEPENQAL